MKAVQFQRLLLALTVSCPAAVALAQSTHDHAVISNGVRRLPPMVYQASVRGTGVDQTSFTVEEEGEVSPQPAAGQPVQTMHTYSHSSALGGFGRCCAGWGGHGCWYGGVYAIVLDRDDDDIALTVRSNNPSDVLLSTGDAEMDWTSGGAITIGRWIHHCTAVEVTYWNIDPDNEEGSTRDINAQGTDPDLIPVLDFSLLDHSDLSGPVSDLFEEAQLHRVRRDYDFQNIEVNFVRATCGSPCSKMGGGCSKKGGHCSKKGSGFSMLGGPGTGHIRYLAGFRYFRMEDNFGLASDDANAALTGDPGEVYYDIDMMNHFLGGQIGFLGDYYWNHHAAFHFGAKGGVFANYIEHRSFLGGSLGAATVNAGPNTGREFFADNDTTEIAFLGETDVAFIYQFSRCLRATIGWRILLLSGAAQSTDQIPGDFSDIDAVLEIDNDSTVLLHGGYLGLEFSH